ncbi:MAG: hypothetical protein ACXWCX_14220, partial [Burkholderiales bacterium]
FSICCIALMRNPKTSEFVRDYGAEHLGGVRRIRSGRNRGWGLLGRLVIFQNDVPLSANVQREYAVGARLALGLCFFLPLNEK